MHRTLSLFLITFILSASAHGFSGNFQGFTMGFGVDYGYNRAKFNDALFKGASVAEKIFGGYGRVYDEVYVGLEIAAGYDNFSQTVKKTPSKKLSRGYFFEGAFRIGQVIRSNFLPFLRVGMGYDQYGLRLQGQKRSFYAQALLVGLGTDAFIDESWSIRSEVSHNWAFKIDANNMSVNKKPSKTALTLSIIHHL